MFDGIYHDWNQKRIKAIIDHYGFRYFSNLKLLDLGCGHGDISGALARLGADITAVDARQEHLKIVSKKWAGVKTVRADLDSGWPFHGKTFDLTLDLALICYLGNYEKHLKEVCGSTSMLVLETAVCDSDDPYKCATIHDGRSNYDGSFNGVLSFPSPAAIERVLGQKGFEFKRIDSSKFNSGPYVYDWVANNSGECNINKRRIWFCYRTGIIREPNLPPPQKFGTPNPTANISSVTPPPQNPRLTATPRPPVPPEIMHRPVEVTIPTPPVTEVSSVKKNIKTAVCLSGHLRTFQENYMSVVSNLFNQLECDVFIHTWDTLGMSYRPLDSRVWNQYTADLKSRIEQLYQPKTLVIEPSRKFEETPLMRSRLIDFRDIPGILSMFYKVEECNKLKKQYEIEHNFTYDCVIRFRGDLFLEQVFPVDYNTDLKKLYLPFYGHFAGLCDQIAWGGSAAMDQYSSLYSNIEKYLRMGCPMQPEKLVRFNIEQHKIPLSKVHLKYVIKRSNGLVQDNMLLEKALGYFR